MSLSHDFEIQLGRNRALRGRGWRGLLALFLFLIAFTTIAVASTQAVSPIRSWFAHLVKLAL
jgi:hypothetical protein